MATNNFTVPTLSLSSSRAKKQTGSSIPTRDYSQYVHSQSYQLQNDNNFDNRYNYKCVNHSVEMQEKNRRPPIFPPKHPTPPIQHKPKDINKNVYLQTYEQTVPPVFVPPRPEQPRYQQPSNSGLGLRRSSSKNGLLTNPESSKLIQEQLQQREVARKLDVSKVLFDRKLSKLLQQANFYDEELQAACQDELGPKLQELMELKDSQINTQRELIMELTALIK